MLTVPGDRRFLGVVNLVLGGLGSRLDLSYEQVDDLQLAVDSVLAAASDVSTQISLELEPREDGVVVRVGPLGTGAVGDDGLRRVLEPLLESVSSFERDDREWLELELVKPVQAGA